MPRFEVGAHFLGMGQRLQHALEIERLGREIVVAGHAVRVDAAALGVMGIAQHARRQRHLEADQLLGPLLRCGGSRGRRNIDGVVGRRQAIARSITKHPHGILRPAVECIPRHPDEIRIGRVVGDQRLGDVGLREKLVVAQAGYRIAKGTTCHGRHKGCVLCGCGLRSRQ